MVSRLLFLLHVRRRGGRKPLSRGCGNLLFTSLSLSSRDASKRVAGNMDWRSLVGLLRGLQNRGTVVMAMVVMVVVVVLILIFMLGWLILLMLVTMILLTGRWWRVRVGWLIITSDFGMRSQLLTSCSDTWSLGLEFAFHKILDQLRTWLLRRGGRGGGFLYQC
jgi:hypothetical protein